MRVDEFSGTTQQKVLEYHAKGGQYSVTFSQYRKMHLKATEGNIILRLLVTGSRFAKPLPGTMVTFDGTTVERAILDPTIKRSLQEAFNAKLV